ncbi:MAG: hypothetical protein DME55_01360 [Verrucomicrobia bacterium]|nr:MAG: hypothetical protein DME55_01360 [Verrucomicrobiota bacterium]
MIFATAASTASDMQVAESYTRQIPSRLVAYAEPKWLKRQQYVYRRKVLPIEGGRVLLRLTQNPIVEVDPSTRECEALGWDIRMPCDKVENLSKEMARRFLDLFSKADAGRLTEAERSSWLKILDHVDFVAFSIDRAAPHYLEGTLERMEPVCIVEWHDGERQRIDWQVARAFSALRAGDQFGAYVKLGKDNSVRSIERIVLLATDGE